MLFSKQIVMLIVGKFTETYITSPHQKNVLDITPVSNDYVDNQSNLVHYRLKRTLTRLYYFKLYTYTYPKTSSKLIFEYELLGVSILGHTSMLLMKLIACLKGIEKMPTVCKFFNIKLITKHISWC